MLKFIIHLCAIQCLQLNLIKVVWGGDARVCARVAIN
jgi:hypothetical protein